MPNLDPEQAQRMLEIAESMKQTVEQISGTLGKTLEDAERKGGDFSKTFKIADNLATRMMDGMQKRWDRFSKSVDKTWATIREDPIKSAARSTDKLSSSLGSMASRVGAAGMGVGGLIGMMLYGKYKEAEYTAAGHRIAQQFKQVGNVSNEVGTKLGGITRGLSVALGKNVGPELENIAKGIAEFGVTSGTAMGSAEFATDGVRRNLIDTTFMLDKLFETATQPTIRQLMVDTNVDLAESQTLVKNIGLAAGGMGMSFQMASGAITQSTSAMRMMGMDAGNVADTMAGMQKGFEGMGMTGQRAGMMAARGIQAVGGALGGMDMGMLGFLGERVTARMAAQPGSGVTAKTGVEAAVAMERGMVGGGKADVFGATMAEMLEYSKSSTSTGAEQYMLLKEMLGGNKEAAHALMALQDQGGTTEEIAKRAEEQAGRLGGILDQAKRQENFFERQMKIMKDAIAKLGVGLLETMMNGFQGLWLLIRYIVDWIKVGGWLPGSGLSDEYKTKFDENLFKLGRATSKSLDRTVGAFNTLTAAAGNTVGFVTGINPDKGIRRAAAGAMEGVSGSSLMDAAGKSLSGMVRGITGGDIEQQEVSDADRLRVANNRKYRAKAKARRSAGGSRKVRATVDFEFDDDDFEP